MVKKFKNHSNPIISSKNASFAIIEAYKTIRTNLTFVLGNKEKKIITISSSLQAEGKSTTSLNLAISFSQLGQKVLLIDADLRRPQIDKKLNISNENGLSSILVGLCKLDEAVVNAQKNFDVLPSGPIPPNPSELLGSDNMTDVLNILQTYYDCIIIDTPPIGVVSDALMVAPKTDGLLMITRHGYTTHDAFKRTLTQIDLAGVKVLGTVLNGANKRESTKKSKYGYGYGYGYGYDKTK